MGKTNDYAPGGTPSTSELVSCMRGSTPAELALSEAPASAISSNPVQGPSESLSSLSCDGVESTILLPLAIDGVAMRSLHDRVDMIMNRENGNLSFSNPAVTCYRTMSRIVTHHTLSTRIIAKLNPTSSKHH